MTESHLPPQPNPYEPPQADCTPDGADRLTTDLIVCVFIIACVLSGALKAGRMALAILFWPVAGPFLLGPVLADPHKSIDSKAHCVLLSLWGLVAWILTFGFGIAFAMGTIGLTQ
jgi:hypothetical protein